jgi:hypothetical protein
VALLKPLGHPILANHPWASCSSLIKHKVPFTPGIDRGHPAFTHRLEKAACLVPQGLGQPRILTTS